MRRFQIEIIVRTIKVRGHGGNKIGAVLARIGLAKLDARDLRNRVSFIGWLERTAEQSGFWNRLGRELGINAGASEKEQFAHPGFAGRVDDVVLNPQIIE